MFPFGSPFQSNSTSMASEKALLALIRASRPSFRNSHDKVAFAVHGAFLASGHVLTATGPAAFAENALSSASTDEVGIEQWNEFDDGYAFRYFNPEKGNQKVLVKCRVWGDKLLVDAFNGSPEAVHLEVSTDDYIGEDGATNYGAQYKNLGGLLSSLDSHVLSKLDRPAPTAGSSRNGATRAVHPPINPLGDDDLYPALGARMYPNGWVFGGRSILASPDYPRWFGGGIGGDQLGFPDEPGVPPGVRFDPYLPPDVAGFEPNRFNRFQVELTGAWNNPDVMISFSSRRVRPNRGRVAYR